MCKMEVKEVNEEDHTAGKNITVHDRKSLRECLSLSLEQQQNVLVFLMQVCMSSMAISLLLTGFTMICVVAGIKNRITINIIIYSSYASLGAIGGVTLMVLLLNIVSGVGTSDD